MRFDFNKIRTLLFLGLLVFSTRLDAGIRLKVIFTHKLGVDNSMILESELHSIEEVFESENINLTMQEGLSLNLWANFVQREKDYGPSPFVEVKGQIYDSTGELIKRLSGKETLFRIGEKKTLTQSTKDERKIELTIIPTVY